MARILAVDDERAILDALARVLVLMFTKKWSE